MIERTPKERLYWLMDLLINNKIGPTDFCNEFYNTYENEVDDQDLSKEEKEMFMIVSQKGSRYSEFEEELKKYPKVYISKNELLNIVIDASRKLEK
jgi:hypothetical protein